MRLPQLTILLGKVPDDLIEYLLGVCSELDLNDDRSRTKEHAFYDAVFRYDATTDFFTPENFFGSLIPPLDSLTAKLKPLYDWLILNHLPEHTVFRAQIIQSPPGSIVLPHTDPRLYHEKSHRVHIVLKTNPGCFGVHFIPERNYDMEFYRMEHGNLYDLDNIIPHAAFNMGSENRIHIIIDIMPNTAVVAYPHIWVGDTNFTLNNTRNEYKRHVQAIEARYGGNDGLKQAYAAYVRSTAGIEPTII